MIVCDDNGLCLLYAGIRINGMNVLAVRQGMAMVREQLSTGNGPMYVEYDTYRYHGHSMSDPGTTQSH